MTIGKEKIIVLKEKKIRVHKKFDLKVEGIKRYPYNQKKVVET